MNQYGHNGLKKGVVRHDLAALQQRVYVDVDDVEVYQFAVDVLGVPDVHDYRQNQVKAFVVGVLEHLGNQIKQLLIKAHIAKEYPAAVGVLADE